MADTQIEISKLKAVKRFRSLTAQLPSQPPMLEGTGALIVVLLLLPKLMIGQQAQSKPGGESPLTITLQNAIERAKANNQQLLSANLNTALAREDRIQARAGLLPSLSYNNQYIYTQGNGTPSGVFVANDGVHIYNSQATIHEEVISLSHIAEYKRTVLAQAIAEAKAQVVARGIVATVAQNYYALVVAQRHYTNAQQSLKEAQSFVDITQKLEKGGEVARSDVLKAQIVLQQRQRDLQESQLAIEKARISVAVLIFPDYRTDFTVVDDLQTPLPLAPFSEIRALATEKNPNLRAAQITLQQESLGVKAAKAGYLPTFSFDYWYGINANEFAIYSGDRRNLGYSLQGSLNFPIWNWGTTKSKIRQAEFRRSQAQLDLSLTQKEVLSELNSLYAEAQSVLTQLDSLHNSLDMASESLRLILLQYQAGEVSVLEVVDAQTTLTQARNAHDDGLSRYRVALANLQTLTGTL
jgi:outer membrane protein TolC